MSQNAVLNSVPLPVTSSDSKLLMATDYNFDKKSSLTDVKSKKMPVADLKTPSLKDTSIDKLLYSVRNNFNRKTNRRNRVLICKFENCNREFTKKWGLKEHYRVHSQEKPFSCQCCKTRFTQMGSLLKHVRKNTVKSHLHCKY